MRWISSVFFIAVAAAPSARAEFCADRSRASLPKTIERVADDPSMRLAFKNQGGLVNGGVCWWHSRFQRAAWYLANFDETGAKPSRAEAKRIIHAIVERKSVVKISGYRDLQTFSQDFKEEIQSALNGWQVQDGFLNQAYLRGMSGRSRYRDDAKMRRRMNNLYLDYLIARPKGDLLWVLLQMRGIVSHSSLLREMDPTGDSGYRMRMVDSNFPEREVEYVYRPGDLELTPANVDVKNYTSVPYAGFERDLERIHGAIARHCDARR